MIDVRESFWSVPSEKWSELWVRVRWEDFDSDVKETSSGECVNLFELASREIDADFGFRGVALACSQDCGAPWLVSPLWLDLDLDGDTQRSLDELLDRVEKEVRRRDWSARVYRSGTGYHVEIDPASIEAGRWWLEPEGAREWRREIRKAAGGVGAPAGGKAVIDTDHDMMRMVGSAHRGGGSKTLVAVWPSR